MIPRLALSVLYGAQKNYLRQLRESAAGLVRPKDSAGSRPVVRGYPGVPGVRGAPGLLPELWQSEARASGVFGGQPVLHQALCVLCGATVSHGDHQRCGQGTEAGLAYGQGVGQAVHEGAAGQGGKTKPKVIGIDEISIRKGHTYRIVVSDLERTQPIWFGGQDRSETSLTQFFDELGKRKRARIRLAVMDMWKPFRNATQACAPQAAILYDKFHVMRHLGEALDQVRKSEYGQLVRKTEASSRGRNTRCCRAGRT